MLRLAGVAGITVALLLQFRDKVVCSVGLEIVNVAKGRFDCFKVGLKDRLNGTALSRHCLGRHSTEDEHKEGL